jgi:hypothetical protein
MRKNLVLLASIVSFSFSIASQLNNSTSAKIIYSDSQIANSTSNFNTPQKQIEIAKKPPQSNQNTKRRDLNQLFSRIWNVTPTAESTIEKGSIYIFLANGTLLNGACVSPYRISSWTMDKNASKDI